jgi:predicted MPP superfamily phosphohydrolase
VPGRVGKRYPAGRFELAPRRTLYASRGVGGVELPVRAWARPEVVVFEITACAGAP